MKLKEKTTWEAPNNDWIPTFTKIPWVNDIPIDYKLLKNKP